MKKPNTGKMEAAENEHDDDVLNAAIAAENMDQATHYEEPIVERVLPRIYGKRVTMAREILRCGRNSESCPRGIGA